MRPTEKHHRFFCFGGALWFLDCPKDRRTVVGRKIGLGKELRKIAEKKFDSFEK